MSAAGELRLTGRFLITLYKARDLVDKELLLKMSPKVIMKIEGCKEEVDSKVCKNAGTHCDWEGEAFILNLQGSESGQFELKVVDKTLLGHNDIGIYKAHLDELNFSNTPHWIKLMSCKHPGKEEGEVMVSFDFQGEGLPEHHRNKKHGKHHPED